MNTQHAARSLQDAGLEPSEIVICMVFDGIEKMHHSMVDYLHHELLLLDPSMLKAKHKVRNAQGHRQARSGRTTKDRRCAVTANLEARIAA